MTGIQNSGRIALWRFGDAIFMAGAAVLGIEIPSAKRGLTRLILDCKEIELADQQLPSQGLEGPWGYKAVTLEDKQWMDELFAMSERGSLEYNFTNTFVWRHIYKLRVARMGDRMLMLSDPENPTFLFPPGRGPLEPVMERLAQDARFAGVPLKFHTVLADHRAWLEAAYPGRFVFEEYRNGADYIYERERLATLKGKKLSAKRNHINRFLENHPDWRYEPLSQGNIPEARQMNLAWCEEARKRQMSDLNGEYCAVEQALRHFDALGLSGGLIRTEGQVVAFSIGDPLSDDTFLVHFEKAFAEIQGAYPMINQQFVLHNCMEYTYVNREDDTGVEGLRKAKLSYDPHHLVEKYIATLKGESLQP